MDSPDYCYECAAYGDDYSLDENGEFVNNCIDCPMNPCLNYWDD